VRNMRTAAEHVPTHWVKTKTGSYPMPAFRARWSRLRQLRWKASLIMAQYPGVRLYVEKGRSWSGSREAGNFRFHYGLFSLSYNNGGMSATTPENINEILIGIELGLRMAEDVKR
jgi:hypothetical protein